MGDDRSRDLTIRDVSEASGLTAHTLRYYERIGLMIPVTRAETGHRQYSAIAVEWVTLLCYLRETGMPIAEMKRFADLVRMGPESVPDRLALLRDHRSAITEQIERLQDALNVVDAKITDYSEGNATTPPVPNDTSGGHQ